MCLAAFSIFVTAVSLVMTREDVSDIDTIMCSKIDETFVGKRNPLGKVIPFTEEELREYREEFSAGARGVVEQEIAIEGLTDATLPDYYALAPSAYDFLDEDDAYDFIGTFATAQDEIMITHYTAEQLLLAWDLPDLTALLGRPLVADELSYTITAILDTHFDGSAYEPLKTGSDEALGILFYRIVSPSRHNALYLSRAAYAGSIEYSALRVPLAGLSRKEVTAIYHAGQEDGCRLYNYAIDCAQNGRSFLQGVEEFFAGLSIFCGVFAAAIMIYFISQSIEDRAVTIAILKTMGAGNLTIWKIFLWESVVFGLAVCLCACAGGAILLSAANAFFTAGSGIEVLVYCLRAPGVLILFATAALCILLGAAIPMYKIGRTNPLRFLD